MTDFQNNPEFEAKLTAWDEAQRQTAHWATREMELRKEIFGTAFPVPVVGTNKIRVGHGMALVATHRINYKIDVAVMDATRSSIPVDVFDDTIRFKPSLNEKAYKELGDSNKKKFGLFVTETPGAPALEIKSASKVRW